MIRIIRENCPSSLKSGGGGRYNAKDVVETLHTMQFGKCCYCEQKIPVSGHIKAVEHFRPKSVFKGLELDWSNLLLVCAQCNGSKSNKFPVELTNARNEVKVVFLEKEDFGADALILDPSDPNEDDPETHICFVVDDSSSFFCFAVPAKNSLRGEQTIQVTGIYKPYYVEMREQHYIMLSDIYLRFLREYRVAKNTGRIDALKEIYNRLMDTTLASSEFAAFSRKFLKEKNITLRFEKLASELAPQ